MTSTSPAATGAGLRLAVLVAVVLASPPHSAYAQSAVANDPVLRDLAGLNELRSQFETDLDKIRIVLLLSPT